MKIKRGKLFRDDWLKVKMKWNEDLLQEQKHSFIPCTRVLNEQARNKAFPSSV